MLATDACQMRYIAGPSHFPENSSTHRQHRRRRIEQKVLFFYLFRSTAHRFTSPLSVKFESVRIHFVAHSDSTATKWTRFVAVGCVRALHNPVSKLHANKHTHKTKLFWSNKTVTRQRERDREKTTVCRVARAFASHGNILISFFCFTIFLCNGVNYIIEVSWYTDGRWLRSVRLDWRAHMHINLCIWKSRPCAQFVLIWNCSSRLEITITIAYISCSVMFLRRRQHSSRKKKNRREEKLLQKMFTVLPYIMYVARWSAMQLVMHRDKIQNAKKSHSIPLVFFFNFFFIQFRFFFGSSE